MIEKRKNILNVAKKFKKICEENKIWYSLNDATLLGAARHAGFVPWQEKFQVFITLEGYNILKKIAPNYLVDSALDKKHKTLTVSFVEDNKNWIGNSSFVEISIAIKTTNKNIKSFRSSSKAVFKTIFGWRDNIKHAINDLYHPDGYEGFLKLVDRKTSPSSEWIQALSLKTEKKTINGIKFNVAKEWDAILKTKYGNDYMNAVVPNSWYVYLDPIKKIVVS